MVVMSASRSSIAAFTACSFATPVGVGKNKLDALLKAGLVKAKLINGRRYFVTASLVAYLDTLADA